MAVNKIKEAFGKDYELLKEMPDYEKALKLAKVMFKDIKDKEGKDYIEHLLFVSNAQDTVDGKVVGLLHDIVEDIKVTFPQLAELGFSERILSSLILLTRVGSTSYSDYIDNILNSNDYVAIKVKEADMRNNMDPERLKNLSPEQQEHFNNKYSKQYEKIKKKIEEIENDRYQTNKRK